MNSGFEKSADVISSDGQKIGQLRGSDGEFLLVHSKGLLKEEQFRIPRSAVEHKESTTGNIVLNLSKEQLLHGREIIEGKPNSALVHGEKSNQDLGIGKQTIRYEPAPQAENMSQGGSSSPIAIEKTSPNYKAPAGYSCDMCNATFLDARSLDAHRRNFHGGPTGI